jgi:hypothetical protein
MKVVLEVRERRFVTTRQTLTRSTFFSSLLSGRRDNQQEDGSYFIDADPALFEHILRYLRRGTLLDQSKGHDYGQYHALLSEARYFGIDALKNWLHDKAYEKTVQVKPSFEVSGHSSPYYLPKTDPRPSPSNVSTEYYPLQLTSKIYMCRRGVREHQGYPCACGSGCRNRLHDKEDEAIDEHAFFKVKIRRETFFNEQVCSADRYL